MSGDGQILWRCRRGTKELDVLLEQYVRRHYPRAGDSERRAFEQILELPDPLLTAYLFGYAAPSQPEFVELIERIATRSRD